MSIYNAEADDAGYLKQKTLVELLGYKSVTIFDIGANIGQSIEKYREIFPACKLYSFEPNPDTFSILHERYNAAPGVRCEQLALGASQGISSFYATNCPEASSLLPPEEFVRKRSPNRNYDYKLLEVPVDTLDNTLQRLNIPAIDILKIDVQGAELGVLQGAESLLKSTNIDIIYLEVLFAENYAGQCDFNDIWNYLKAFGYIVWDIFPFLHTDHGRLWTGNALFISPAVMGKIDPRR